MITKVKIFSLEEIGHILADVIICQTDLIRIEEQPITIRVLTTDGTLNGLRVETKARKLTAEELDDSDL